MITTLLINYITNLNNTSHNKTNASLSRDLSWGTLCWASEDVWFVVLLWISLLSLLCSLWPVLLSLTQLCDNNSSFNNDARQLFTSQIPAVKACVHYKRRPKMCIRDRRTCVRVVYSTTPMWPLPSHPTVVATTEHSKGDITNLNVFVCLFCSRSPHFMSNIILYVYHCITRLDVICYTRIHSDQRK